MPARHCINVFPGRTGLPGAARTQIANSASHWIERTSPANAVAVDCTLQWPASHMTCVRGGTPGFIAAHSDHRSRHRSPAQESAPWQTAARVSARKDWRCRPLFTCSIVTGRIRRAASLSPLTTARPRSDTILAQCSPRSRRSLHGGSQLAALSGPPPAMQSRSSARASWRVVKSAPRRASPDNRVGRSAFARNTTAPISALTANQA